LSGGTHAAIESSFLDILTRYILPPVLGGGAGFFTVYANWGIEKRRQRLAQRKEHIASWRNALLPLLPPNTGWSGVMTSQFMASPAFASLEPHLSPELLKKMRAERTVYVGGDFPRRDLIAEIGRLEKRWGLV
jgi:hypothetical protein